MENNSLKNKKTDINYKTNEQNNKKYLLNCEKLLISDKNKYKWLINRKKL